MKTAFLFFGFLIAYTALFGQSLQATHWGASRRDVVSSMKSQPTFLSGNDLTYDSTQIAGYPLRLHFGFKSDKLYTADYIAKAPLADSLKLKAAFLTILEGTIIDLGEPKVEGDDDVVKLVFRSQKGNATIFHGIADGYCRLMAYFFAPLPATKKQSIH